MALFYHVDKDKYLHEPGAEVPLELLDPTRVRTINQESLTFWRSHFCSEGFSWFGYRMLWMINWPPPTLTQFDHIAIKREIIFEEVRERDFPERPSRFQSMFAFMTLAEAEDYRLKSGGPKWPIWLVESEDFFVGDMGLYNSADPSRYHEVAGLYWSGERSEKKAEEVLLRLPVRIMEKAKGV